MVTYGELFTYSLVLIGFASPIIQLCKKKMTAQPHKLTVIP